MYVTASSPMHTPISMYTVHVVLSSLDSKYKGFFITYMYVHCLSPYPQTQRRLGVRLYVHNNPRAGFPALRALPDTAQVETLGMGVWLGLVVSSCNHRGDISFPLSWHWDSAVVST